jgi:hypothetical protein
VGVPGDPFEDLDHLIAAKGLVRSALFWTLFFIGSQPAVPGDRVEWRNAPLVV